MHSHESQAERKTSSYAEFAAQLQELRVKAGSIPYAEIVRRIGEQRVQRGVPAAYSRPARSTVYDAFNPERTRVNAELISEIVQALGVPEAEAGQWVQLACAACAPASEAKPESSGAYIEPVLDSLPAPRPAPQKQPEPAVHTPVDGTPQDSAAEDAPRRAPGWGAKGLLMLGCMLLNLLGFFLVAFFHIPLYLDMIGTAVAAFALGPWAGAAVALGSNAAGVAITDSTSLAFALVNISGALLWGYARRWVLRGEVVVRFLLLNTLVAVVCTVVASMLLVELFGGVTGHASEQTTATSVLSSRNRTTTSPRSTQRRA